MLNTPQVSFAVANGNQQQPSSQVSLGSQQNWDHTLEHFNNEQKPSSIHTANTQTLASADVNNIVSRADTLDRIPVFVNPHDLNQTNQASNFREFKTEYKENTNQDNATQNISHHVQDSQQQSQIKLGNTSTPQVCVQNTC